jgi:hypothetical protein
MESQVPSVYWEGGKQVAEKSKRIAAQTEILHPLPLRCAFRAARLPETIDTVLQTHLEWANSLRQGESTTGSEAFSRKRLKSP